MIESLRNQFNSQFSEEKYQAFLKDQNDIHAGAIEFRVAETPIFIPWSFTQKMLDACESIVDIITDEKFKPFTERAIPANARVPGENDHTDFIAFDFGICKADDGELVPQLIEMQGFPTLFAYQIDDDKLIRRHFDIPGGFSPYLNGYNEESYTKLLRNIIVNGHAPKEVILLEIKPHEQKTRIDFYCTQKYLGIAVVCLTELVAEGDQLYYYSGEEKIRIKRIYNRIIFDELYQMKDLPPQTVDITRPYDVEWVPHPNWFYRISKFTLPFIHHEWVPETWFLNEVTQLREPLDNFVLKPLFSFAGQGVVIDVTQEDLDKVTDPENWILQKKVNYADVIQTPDGPAKAEIRIFYFWPPGAKRPVAVNNLARLSKGKMIGVRYNMDKRWVGGSIAYFEKPH